MHLLVAGPLLELGHVVPDLHTAGPVAHILAQQQVVQGAGADEVEHLLEDLRNYLRVQPVLAEDGMEAGEQAKQLVQGLVRVNVGGRVHAASGTVAAAGLSWSGRRARLVTRDTTYAFMLQDGWDQDGLYLLLDQFGHTL